MCRPALSNTFVFLGGMDVPFSAARDRSETSVTSVFPPCHATGPHRVSSWPMPHSPTVHKVQKRTDISDSQMLPIVCGGTVGEHCTQTARCAILEIGVWSAIVTNTKFLDKSNSLAFHFSQTYRNGINNVQICTVFT